MWGDVGPRPESVKKVAGECKDVVHNGLDMNHEKLHQFFMVLQNMELNSEILGKMVKGNVETSNKKIVIKAKMKTDNPNICNRLHQIIVNQGIDGSHLRQIQGGITNTKIRIFNQKGTPPGDQACNTS